MPLEIFFRQEKNHACFPITFEIRSDEWSKPYLISGFYRGPFIFHSLTKEKKLWGLARYGKSVRNRTLELIGRRSEGFYEPGKISTDNELALLKGKDQALMDHPFLGCQRKALRKNSRNGGLKGNPKAFASYSFGGLIALKNSINILNVLINWCVMEAPDPQDEKARNIIDEYSKEFLEHYSSNFTDTTKVQMAKDNGKEPSLMYEFLFNQTSNQSRYD
ncbi:hypothetical protein FQA39_LY18516 [Lamprigera yunnana]|nr:hypothetical protein FQA39_LY18516 [Lamprigera yunnana]